jgi:hypothetical protein
MTDPIVFTRHPVRVTVENAPRWSLIALEFLVAADKDLVHATEDRLHFGRTPDGRQVVYRVVGWDAEGLALIVERVSPKEMADD